jgi:hypothetical protein
MQIAALTAAVQEQGRQIAVLTAAVQEQGELIRELVLRMDAHESSHAT